MAILALENCELGKLPWTAPYRLILQLEGHWH
jgi:hypothetical protein